MRSPRLLAVLLLTTFAAQGARSGPARAQPSAPELSPPGTPPAGEAAPPTAPEKQQGKADARAEVKKTPARKRKPKKREAPVELYGINTKELLMLRLRDDQGRPVRGVQQRLNRFLRCHHTKVVRPINPRLIRVLYQVGKHYSPRRLEVISGYRHPRVSKNPRSPHMKGRACDFRVVGVTNAELRDYLRKSYENVGVGFYPNSSFVHLDVRKDRSAFWIDYAGPGEGAVYSKNPVADLKTGRVHTYKPYAAGQGADDTDDALRAEDKTPPPADDEPAEGEVKSAGAGSVQAMP